MTSAGHSHGIARNLVFVVLAVIMVIVAVGRVLYTQPALPATTYRFLRIDFPGAMDTVAHSLNWKNEVAGYFRDAGGAVRGFVYRPDAGFRTIDFPGSSFTVAYAINNLGDVVGYYQDSGTNEHGFVFSEGKFVSIDYPGSVWTRALGINDNGTIVGSYRSGGGTGITHFGFTLEHGQFRAVHVQQAFITSVWDISNSTLMVGTVRMSHGDQCFYGSVALTPFNPRLSTYCYGVGDSLVPFGPRQIVGRYVDTEARSHGFISVPGSLTTIDVPGAVYTAVHGINIAGVISGHYRGEGASHGFLGFPGP
jgi:probable HAF family extracellular repeat protein